MRLSCNGCRVLRKGCAEACTIRPCLQWIKSPEAQGNATVFLAKFYGRAGLLNLVAAAPSDALRPAVFRSLLYEACGRIVNPVYGAVGLLWNGTWHLCQAAVEAVLKGAPIVVVDDAAAGAGAGAPPISAAAAAAAACDIRHVFPKSSSSSSSSNKQWSPPAAAAAAPPPPPPPPAVPVHAAAQAQSNRLLHLHRVVSKRRFKRTSSPSKKTKQPQPQPHLDHAASPATEHHTGDDAMLVAVADQDHQSASASEEEAASHVSQAVADHQAEAEQPPPSMALDLTLGLFTSTSSAAVDQPAGVIAFRFL